jgi:hypothetical protein
MIYSALPTPMPTPMPNGVTHANDITSQGRNTLSLFQLNIS